MILIVFAVLSVVWVLGFVTEQKKENYELKWVFDVFWPIVLMGEIAKKVYRKFAQYVRYRRIRKIHYPVS